MPPDAEAAEKRKTDPTPEPTSEPAALAIDEILGASDAKFERVPTPEWGGAVYVRALSGNERDDFEQYWTEQIEQAKPHGRRPSGFRAAVVGRSLCDAGGNPTPATPLEIEKLGGKNAAPLDRVFDVCMRLSRLSAKDVEELEGN